MKRFVWIAAPLLFSGCMMQNEGDQFREAYVTDAPDLSKELPQMKLRVGIFVAREVREQAETVADVRTEPGLYVVSELEAQCRRVFPATVSLHQLPPEPFAVEEIDCIVVVSSKPDVVWAKAETGSAATVTVRFAVHAVSGAKVDETSETVGDRVILGRQWAQNQSVVREAIHTAVRGAVYRFLCKAPDFMNRRYDK